MPIRTSYEKEHNLRLHVVTGIVTADEFTEELAEVYGSDEIPAEVDVIWDLVDADVSGISTGEVRQISEFVKRSLKKAPGYRVAFVSGTDLTYGMTRMYEQMQLMFDEDLIRVFRLPEEAWAWLGTDRGEDRS